MSEERPGYVTDAIEMLGKGYRIEGRPPTIFRVIHDKDNPYVMVNTTPILNVCLSWKAKGILTYLMSRPDGWEVSVADLVKRSVDGKASVRAGLKELRDAGHMRYTVSRDEGRITGWNIEVYELPQDGPKDDQPTDEIIDEAETPQVGDTTIRLSVSGGSPESDFQEVENQQIENRTQVLKTLSTNDSKKYKHTREKPNFVSLTVQQAAALPEIRVYHETTGIIPGSGQWETVWQTIRGMNGKGDPEYLRPFWLAWTAKGYRPNNLDWLTEWAVSGEIPAKQKSAPKMKGDRSDFLAALERA